MADYQDGMVSPPAAAHAPGVGHKSQFQIRNSKSAIRNLNVSS